MPDGSRQFDRGSHIVISKDGILYYARKSDGKTLVSERNLSKIKRDD